MATLSHSTEASLINTMVIVKPPIMNIEHDNPSKQTKNFEERTQEQHCLGFVQGANEGETRRGGRRSEMATQLLLHPPPQDRYDTYYTS